MRRALLLAAACGGSSPAPAPAPGPQPIANVANVAPALPAPPASTCIAPDAPIVDARLVDGVLVACYYAPRPSDDADDCWRFNLATSRWSFVARKPHADVAPRPPSVTATATSASVCTPDGSDCKTIPLSGIKLSPDDVLSGATNVDRSIVAVWASGPVHVFDASGKRLATIKPWPTDMSGKDPSVFREAHVLGSTIEVRIADTPISSAIRLYEARGKKIADVFGGQPMEDGAPPLELGGSRYAFLSIEPRTIVITDVATGKQLGSYPAPGEALSPAFLMRTPDGNVAGVMGTNAVMLDIAAGKLTSVAAPSCAP